MLTIQYQFKRQIPGSRANEQLGEQQLIRGRLGGDEGDELGEGEAVLAVLRALKQIPACVLLLAEAISRQPTNG